MQLEKELNIEKNKNKDLEKKILELTDKIKNYELNKPNNKIIESKELLFEKIMQKDNEINELKNKLSKFPFELKDDERLMTVNFKSDDQKIQNYSIICKNTDSFNRLENEVYKEYKEFYETENYFTVNGKKIHKNKTLEENGIHNNDVIILNILDFD